MKEVWGWFEWEGEISPWKEGDGDEAEQEVGGGSQQYLKGQEEKGRQVYGCKRCTREYSDITWGGKHLHM